MTPIINYEDKYTIDILGNIKNIKTNKLLAHHINVQTGYVCIDLWKNNKGTKFYLHRLLAIHFIKNPKNKPEINHKDGIRTNFKLCNLEWCTRVENINHAISTGLRIYKNRLTKEEFIELLNAVIKGESYLSLTTSVPYKSSFLSVKLRKIAKELNVEDELNNSLKLQKIERNRKTLLLVNSKYENKY